MSTPSREYYQSTLGDQPPLEWGDVFDQLVFRGNPLLNEVVHLHKPSKTVSLGDMIQFNVLQDGRPLQNFIFSLAGISPGHAGMGLDMRLTSVDRAGARRSLQRLLSWEFDKLIIAHGPGIEQDAEIFVERAFRWLAH